MNQKVVKLNQKKGEGEKGKSHKEQTKLKSKTEENGIKIIQIST